MKPEIKTFLEKHNITYTLHEHAPVHTVEEARKVCKQIPGLHCKNLFLKDKKADQYYLVIMPALERLDIKKLAQEIDVKKLTFGSGEKLLEYLNVTPGSVSPFGLLYDEQKQVIPLVAKKVYEADIVSFHPNENNASLELTKENFHLLLDSLKHEIRIVEI